MVYLYISEEKILIFLKSHYYSLSELFPVHNEE